MPDFVRFQTRVILDLYGVPFHAMVVVGSEHDFSIKSASAYCEVKEQEGQDLLSIFGGLRFELQPI